MAKPNLAGKLKNLARDLKDGDKNQDGVKKSAEKTSEVRKKQNIGDGKLSGRKN